MMITNKELRVLNLRHANRVGAAAVSMAVED